MKYNKDEIKNNLTFQQVFDYVAELGGNPKLDPTGAEVFISQTICHNPVGSGSHKLYYYGNTKLFHCWTQCGDSFDIFDLTRKWASQRGEEWTLPRAVKYVANYFGIAALDEENFNDNEPTLADWELLKKYKQTNSFSNEKQRVEFKECNENILAHYPQPRIEPWIAEGISQSIMNNRGICYDPVNCGIIIPHYDENGALIGIRERTLIKEEEQYGKYRPAIINGKMYNHPLGFALYNLNYSKANIPKYRTAIVFEGEKSCLKYASYFGSENDISVATCGSNLIQHQVELLIQYGAVEICIAFDKEGEQDKKDQYVKKFYLFREKYSKFVHISFIYDKDDKYLKPKDSPIDRGADIFLKLFKERITL